eukprot:gene7543-20469_t
MVSDAPRHISVRMYVAGVDRPLFAEVSPHCTLGEAIAGLPDCPGAVAVGSAILLGGREHAPSERVGDVVPQDGFGRIDLVPRDPLPGGMMSGDPGWTVGQRLIHVSTGLLVHVEAVHRDVPGSLYYSVRKPDGTSKQCEPHHLREPGDDPRGGRPAPAASGAGGVRAAAAPPPPVAGSASGGGPPPGAAAGPGPDGGALPGASLAPVDPRQRNRSVPRPVAPGRTLFGDLQGCYICKCTAHFTFPSSKSPHGIEYPSCPFAHRGRDGKVDIEASKRAFAEWLVLPDDARVSDPRYARCEQLRGEARARAERMRQQPRQRPQQQRRQAQSQRLQQQPQPARHRAAPQRPPQRQASQPHVPQQPPQPHAPQQQPQPHAPQQQPQPHAPQQQPQPHAPQRQPQTHAPQQQPRQPAGAALSHDPSGSRPLGRRRGRSAPSRPPAPAPPVAGDGRDSGAMRALRARPTPEVDAELRDLVTQATAKGRTPPSLHVFDRRGCPAAHEWLRRAR